LRERRGHEEWINHEEREEHEGKNNSYFVSFVTFVVYVFANFVATQAALPSRATRRDCSPPRRRAGCCRCPRSRGGCSSSAAADTRQPRRSSCSRGRRDRCSC